MCANGRAQKTKGARWDTFARDWIAAQAGHDPFGASLAFDPDTNHDGKIGAQEAFSYANAIKNPSDSPNFSESSPAGGEIGLGQDYIIWWWWCFILREVLEPYYLKLQHLQADIRRLRSATGWQPSGTLKRGMVQ